MEQPLTSKVGVQLEVALTYERRSATGRLVTPQCSIGMKHAGAPDGIWHRGKPKPVTQEPRAYRTAPERYTAIRTPVPIRVLNQKPYENRVGAAGEFS